MYRPKPVQPIRLATLERVPTVADLHSFHEQVRQSPGRRFELPIVLDNGERSFLLVATLDPSGGDPEFSFYSGLGIRAPLQWTHATYDMPFLLNLLLNELTGASLQDAVSTSSASFESGLGLNPSLFGTGAGAPSGAQGGARDSAPSGVRANPLANPVANPLSNPQPHPLANLIANPLAGLQASAQAPYPGVSPGGLVAAEQNQGAGATASSVTAVETVVQMLSRSDTHIFGYPAMAYFLDQEFRRRDAGGPPFALALFEMMSRDSFANLQPPSLAVIAEVARRLQLVQRGFDLFGHWGTTEYAILLPQIDATATALAVSRVTEIIRDRTIEGGINPDNLVIAFGVGSVPEDCHEWDALVAGAKEAKDQAKRSSAPLVTMRDLRSGGW